MERYTRTALRDHALQALSDALATSLPFKAAAMDIGYLSVSLGQGWCGSNKMPPYECTSGDDVWCVIRLCKFKYWLNIWFCVQGLYFLDVFFAKGRFDGDHQKNLNADLH